MWCPNAFTTTQTRCHVSYAQGHIQVAFCVQEVPTTKEKIANFSSKISIGFIWDKLEQLKKL